MFFNCGVGEDLRVPWTARRSNQSILNKISPEYLLEWLMLKLKLQSFGHLTWRTDSLEKTLMLGKIEGRRRRGQQRMRWLNGITDSKVFPHSWVGKEYACNTGDPGSIPGLGRFSWEGNVYPLPYSCLENPMDRGAWQATIHRIKKVGHNLATKPLPPPNQWTWVWANSRR